MAAVEILDDPVESAEAGGLRYVTDSDPGILRRRAGKGFTYVNPDGSTVKSDRVLQRIRSIAIPPAWTDVWICTSPRGHVRPRAGTPVGASSTATTRTGG